MKEKKNMHFFYKSDAYSMEMMKFILQTHKNTKNMVKVNFHHSHTHKKKNEEKKNSQFSIWSKKQASKTKNCEVTNT